MLPNARANLVKNKTSGTDELVDKVLLNENGPEALLFKEAKAIYLSRVKRQYVEACLLATNNLEEISDLLEIDLEILRFYALFFYDVGGLDKLSRLELLSVSDRQEGLLKLWATSQGLQFIAWRLGKPVSINPVDGLKDLFTTCVYKSKEALFSGNESEASKEATKWTKLSMDLARLLKAWVLDSDAAKKDIELALQQVAPDFDGFDSLDSEYITPKGIPSESELDDSPVEIGSLEDILSQS